MRHAAGQLADRFHFLRLPQRTLGRPFTGNVTRHRMDHSAIGHRGPAEQPVSPVAGHVAVLERQRGHPAAQLFHFGRGRRHVVGMQEVAQHLAHHFMRGPAQVPGGCRVDRGNAPREIANQHQLLRQAPDAVQVARVLRLQQLALMDVGRGAYPLAGKTDRRAQWQGPHEMPEVCAVGTSQAHFRAVRRAGRHACLPGGQRLRCIVGMDETGPFMAIDARGRRAVVFVELIVGPVDAAVRRSRPYLVGQGLRKGAELGGAFPHGLLGGLAFGAVAQHLHESDRQPRFVAQRGHLTGRPERLAGLAHIPAFLGASALDERRPHLVLWQAGGKVFGREQRRAGLPQHLVGGPPENAPCAFVPLRDLAVEVECNDRVIHRAVEDLAVPRVRLALGRSDHFPLRDIDAFDEDADDQAIRVPDRLVDEVDETVDGRAARDGLDRVERAGRGNRLAGPENLVEHCHVTLVQRFRQRLRHGFTDHIAMADQFRVARIDALDPVFRSVQHGHESRRLLEQRDELLPLELELPGDHFQAGLLVHLCEHADDMVAVEHRGIVEIEPGALRMAVALQYEELLPVAYRFPRQHPAHDFCVEVGRFGPHVAHGAAERHRVLVAQHRCIAVVVEQYAVLAPQQRHGRWTANHQRDGSLEARRP